MFMTASPLPNLIDEKDRVLYADSAYSGKPVQDKLPASLDCQIHEKGYKNHPPSQTSRKHPIVSNPVLV